MELEPPFKVRQRPSLVDGVIVLDARRRIVEFEATEFGCNWRTLRNITFADTEQIAGRGCALAAHRVRLESNASRNQPSIEGRWI